MLSLIGFQIVVSQSIRQRDSLPERKAEAFAGDGVDRPGSIADQRGMVAKYSLEAPRCRDSSALRAGYRRSRETALQLREGFQRLINALLAIAGKKRDADFVRADRRYVDLEAGAPVNFDAIGPRFALIVAAKSEARRFFAGCIQAEHA